MIKSGQHGVVGSGCGEPLLLGEALVKEAKRFENLRLSNMGLGSSYPYLILALPGNTI